MAVPDFQSFFVPLLRVAADGKEHTLSEARDRIAHEFALSADELAEKLPSGLQTKFSNRADWAKTYFVRAGVLSSPRRGSFCITERGHSLLEQGYKKIDIKVLSQYPEFVEFHHPNRKEVDLGTPAEPIQRLTETPEEILQAAYQSIRHSLADDLLERVKGNTPKFFESLVVDLMVAMGYGGSREDAARSIGQSGDEGVDGIIKEDRLGLDIIYLQAKKWEGSVGRPEIQKFVGALIGKRAKRGVFITTGRFSEDAVDYARSNDPKVVLIDGDGLVAYMIEFGLGTTRQALYEIQKVDSDYFVEE
jgi:restriction system protein